MKASGKMSLYILNSEFSILYIIDIQLNMMYFQ